MGVYFICDEGRTRVKIGVTSRPVRVRLAGLQTGNPDRLAVLRSIDAAGPAVERWLHLHYASRRLSGEWFRYCETMLTVQPPVLEDAPRPQSPAMACDQDRLRRAFAFARLTGCSSIGTEGAARAARLSVASIRQAKTILTHGSPHDQDDVLAGRMSLADKAAHVQPFKAYLANKPEASS